MLVLWPVLVVLGMQEALAVVSSFDWKSDRNDRQKPVDSDTCMTNQGRRAALGHVLESCFVRAGVMDDVTRECA